jgi:hypothetical protein
MAIKYSFLQKSSGMFSLITLRTAFKLLGWLELVVGGLLFLASMHALYRGHLTPHPPPNDDLGPVLIIFIVMPNALFLLMGGIAAIRKWRHPLLWQILPIAVLMFVIFIAVGSLLRI